MNVKRIAACTAALIMAFSAVSVQARDSVTAAGSGITVHNPIIWADVPDNDVIRVGDTYYMVSTTMFFSPGAPIMKSNDLVSWEICNYVFDTYANGDVQNLKNGKNDYSHGPWATRRRYNEKRRQDQQIIMIFKKPNIKYTDMAIYIDQNAYLDNSEEVNNLIFQYIFHLVEMLAYKARYFKSYEQYQDFSLYAASDIYMRLKNPKQFEYNNEGEPRLRKIKSILNYIKKVIYAKKVDFEQQYYDQSFSHETLNVDCGVGYTFGDSLVDLVDELDKIDFNECLESIPKTIAKFFKSLQFEDKKLKLNLELSCLLTFLNQITPATADIERIKATHLTWKKKDELIEGLYQRLVLDDVILFDLKSSYQKYVFVLTNEIKHLIAQELSLLTNTQVSSESNLKSILRNDIIKTMINNGDD